MTTLLVFWFRVPELKTLAATAAGWQPIGGTDGHESVSVETTPGEAPVRREAGTHVELSSSGVSLTVTASPTESVVPHDDSGTRVLTISRK